jgi:nucleotide-binding universal stress UspA family protein
MALDTIVVATDGSEEALRAALAGFALLRLAHKVVVVTVIEDQDESLVTGGGMAGGVMSPQEFDVFNSQLETNGRTVVEEAAAAIGVEGVEILVRRGDPGPVLCRLAEERSAQAIVMGSRGRGGIKRALLGSVSDYVVRNAPCTVVVTRPDDNVTSSRFGE